MRAVDEARIAELEPDLAGRFRKGLFFADEGHLDPRVALSALTERLRARGGEIRFGVDGEALGEADVVIDCRGWAARKALPQLRGVRGEMMRIRSREVTLARAVRFLHPRIPLYIVPRANNEFMIGATMIESAEKGAVSVRSAIELLSAAYALHPAFGEAEILEMSADVRPPSPTTSRASRSAAAGSSSTASFATASCSRRLSRSARRRWRSIGEEAPA